MNDWYITPTDYQQAKTNGISPQLLNNRVRQLCWPIEKAISTPPRKARVYQKHSADWIKIAEANGINYMAYVQRINILGWAPERAATEPIHLPPGKRRIFPELKIALANGIKANTFYVRIKRGMSPEEAATMSIMSYAEIGRKGGKAFARKIAESRRRVYERAGNHAGS